MIWHHIEKGQGRPLVLLHGIGMNSDAWLPVMDRLAVERRVIAFDIPGFGLTPGLETGKPGAAEMAASLSQSLQEMGIKEPVDLVGNSLGGRIALEAASMGLARSIVCISPAGLWKKTGPAHLEPLFNLMRKATNAMPDLVERVLHNALGRTLIMSGAVAAQGWKMPVDDAVRSARMFAESRHFDPVFDAFRPPFAGASRVTVPCTIAFGDLDFVFPAFTRDKSRAPANTFWVRLPFCGHVPMWDNPERVSQVILRGTR
ncbi:alpha/beta fold hydrolase [Ketobacter sp. MCCC 1A13808]|uniref:alpha/beta fold hydrolase n=1 Tax=Ketobacter sp. MCCC 1A13808 TaxID=2602738 RepID=UPI000F1804B3|nr:alpha/beta fold hydrolase [Ketobacter sp. MCCC 1A13808]MVF11700.1 alpha/beta fold hydrolase [Ketobacter sp. MCCC 1A13808]RLP55312.1 MAG: alpha/beta fold hydrolase [Ketobacter sp.]